MTGKDEWRVIHCGPGGILTDSVNTKKDKEKKDQNTNTFIAEGPAIGAMMPQTGQQANAATRRRASEMPGGQGQPGAFPRTPGQPPDMAGIAPVPGQPGYPGMTPGQPGMPGTVPGIPGQPGQAGQPVMPGQPQPVLPGQPLPGQPGMPGGFPPAKQPYPQGQPGTGSGSFIGGGSFVGGSASGSTSPVPGQTGAPGGPMGSQQGAYPYPTTPGQQTQGPGYPQPGTQGNQNEAVRMIQQILTSPRQQGAPANSPMGMGMGGQNVGGGIAGFASTLEQDSIIVYEEHQKYNEWEFIYDMSKDRTGAGMRNSGTVGTPADKMNSQPGGFGQQPGTGFGQQQGSGFGQQPNFGSQPGRRD